MSDPADNITLAFLDRMAELRSSVGQDPLSYALGGGTPPGMDDVRAKLAEHDGRLARIEDRLGDIASELSNAKFWFVGTALAIFVGMAALCIGLWTFTANLNSSALAAIQTVIAARPLDLPPTPPPAPMVIVVPAYPQAQAVTPAPGKP